MALVVIHRRRDSSPAISCICIDAHSRNNPHLTRWACAHLVLVSHRLIDVKWNPIQSNVVCPIEAGFKELDISIHQTGSLFLCIHLLSRCRILDSLSGNNVSFRFCHCQQSTQPTFNLINHNSFNQSSVAPTLTLTGIIWRWTRSLAAGKRILTIC